MYTVDWADRLSLEWVEQNVDFDLARQNDRDPQFNPRNNQMKEPARWTGHAGMWRIDNDGQCAVLIRVPVLCATPGEKDWEYASRYPETLQYAEWMRQGIMPPPVGMLRHVNGDLILLNRRRWLAARAAGVQDWLVWYWGPPHEVHCSRSRWWFPDKSEYHVSQYKSIAQAGGNVRRSLGDFAFGRMQAAGIAT